MVLQPSPLFHEQAFFNPFTNKVQPMQSYDDVVTYFSSYRLLPLINNALNRQPYLNPLKIYVPNCAGEDYAYCLGNNQAQTLLNVQTAVHLNAVNNVWDCIVMAQFTGKDKHGTPQYLKVAKANLKKQDDACYFVFQQMDDVPNVQYMIDQFKADAVNFTTTIMQDFNNTPLMKILLNSKDDLITTIKTLNQEATKLLAQNKQGHYQAQVRIINQDVVLQALDNQLKPLPVKIGLFSYANDATIYQSLTKKQRPLFINPQLDEQAYDEVMQPIYLQLRSYIYNKVKNVNIAF